MRRLFEKWKECFIVNQVNQVAIFCMSENVFFYSVFFFLGGGGLSEDKRWTTIMIFLQFIIKIFNTEKFLYLFTSHIGEYEFHRHAVWDQPMKSGKTLLFAAKQTNIVDFSAIFINTITFY